MKVHRQRSPTLHICYLCGHPIDGEVSQDHVPPKSFYPKVLRQGAHLNLQTLATHKACNKSYQRDEEYFYYSLGIAVRESSVADSLWNDLEKRMLRKEAPGLFYRIIQEFAYKIGPLYLPNNMRVKLVDDARVSRVMWKIVRGLYYIDKHIVLPETSFHCISKFHVTPAIIAATLFDNDTQGVYREVFAHSKAPLPEVHGWHLWTMTYWGAISTAVYFQHPECGCENCNNMKNKRRPDIGLDT